jgi:hypothetical protein
VSPGTLANLYGALGDSDRAFALFDEAYEARDNIMVLLKVDPFFDSLRADPRFATLLNRIGFSK